MRASARKADGTPSNVAARGCCPGLLAVTGAQLLEAKTIPVHRLSSVVPLRARQLRRASSHRPCGPVGSVRCPGSSLGPRTVAQKQRPRHLHGSRAREETRFSRALGRRPHRAGAGLLKGPFLLTLCLLLAQKPRASLQHSWRGWPETRGPGVRDKQPLLAEPPAPTRVACWIRGCQEGWGQACGRVAFGQTWRQSGAQRGRHSSTAGVECAWGWFHGGCLHVQTPVRLPPCLSLVSPSGDPSVAPSP